MQGESGHFLKGVKDGQGKGPTLYEEHIYQERGRIFPHSIARVTWFDESNNIHKFPSRRGGKKNPFEYCNERTSLTYYHLYRGHHDQHGRRR